MNRLHLLGALDLRDAAGNALRSVLAQPKRVALLTWLCLEGGFQRRDTILALFWPESSTERARHSLNQALYALRRSLGANAIGGRGSEEVGVDPDRLWCDVIAFQDALAQGRPAEALELYRDDLLKGFFLDGAPEFERWLDGARTRLRASAAEAAWQLARGEEESGNGAGVVFWGRRALAYAPDDEARLRELLQALARTGQPGLACREYDAFAARLRDEYELEPEPSTQAIIAEVKMELQAESVPAPVGAEPARAVEPGGGTEPMPATPTAPGVLTPFVGREAELERLAELLAEKAARLVTVVGPAGAGKTRLSLEAASRAASAFPDGVVFVPLARVTGADRVVGAVTKELGLGSTEASAERQLLGHLRDRRMLLVLDNMDHVVAGAAALARILGGSPDTKVLATSREALNVRGEWLLPLDGMRVEPDSSSDAFAESESVRLFLEAAHRTQPDFALGHDDRPSLAKLLQLVDGLPLGIELAASWTRALGLPAIVEELNASRLALSNPMQDAPGRHASLEAALAYSWHTLSPEQAATINALSVFRGGFTRGAAQDVARGSLAMVRALLDKSLLQRQGIHRYGMLEVIREYAAQRLAEDPAALAMARGRHRDHYARFLRERASALAADERVSGEVQVELHNLRAAWDHAVETSNLPGLEAMLEPMFILFDRRGDYEEAAGAFGRASASCPPTRPALRARLLSRQGALSLRAGLVDAALVLLAEALELARAAGEATESALILDRMGVALYQLGRFDEARARQEESLHLRRSVGHRAGVATSLNNLGSLSYATGDYADAVQRFTESLRFHEELTDEPGAILSLHNLAFAALMLGRSEDAVVHLETALERARATGSNALVARSLCNLASAEHSLGRSEDARDGFLRALDAAGNEASPLVLEIMLGLVGPLARLGDAPLAAGIAGFVAGHPAAEEGRRQAAARLLDGLGSWLPTHELERHAARWQAAGLAEVLAGVRGDAAHTGIEVSRRDA